MSTRVGSVTINATHVRAILAFKNMTQVDLAKKLKMNSKALAFLLSARKKRSTAWYTATRIAKELQVDVSTIIVADTPGGIQDILPTIPFAGNEPPEDIDIKVQRMVDERLKEVNESLLASVKLATECIQLAIRVIDQYKTL